MHDLTPTLVRSKRMDNLNDVAEKPATYTSPVGAWTEETTEEQEHGVEAAGAGVEAEDGSGSRSVRLAPLEVEPNIPYLLHGIIFTSWGWVP